MAGQVAAVKQLFATDPQGAVAALAQVVQQGVMLTASRMSDDGWHEQNNERHHNNGSSGTIRGRSSKAIVQPSSASADSNDRQRQLQVVAGPASRLYVDWMAAAAAAGAYSVLDTASAVEEACQLFQARLVRDRLQCIGCCHMPEASLTHAATGLWLSDDVAMLRQLLLL